MHIGASLYIQDIEAMRGSTVDAMSDAIDRSVKMIYGISLEVRKRYFWCTFV
jgi:hypothetical protein|eukprot:COSAG06_NODE_6668_length_2834_cov_3.785009_1_plen_52_part_00